VTSDDARAPSIVAAVERSLEDTPRLPRDGAAVELARLYATLIDDAVDRLSDAAEDDQARDFARMTITVERAGRRLESVLDRLGMTPAARPATRGGDPHGAPPDPARAALDALRGGTAAPPGLDYAAAVDPAVTAADA
jgi:hypothetical protein